MAWFFLHLAVSFDFPKPIPRTDPPPGAPLSPTAINAFTLLRPADPLDEAQQSIQNVLNRAKDWIRYAPNCWILYTSSDASTWYKRLSKISGIKKHTFFICELNITNRGGWLPKGVWDWIKQDRV